MHCPAIPQMTNLEQWSCALHCCTCRPRTRFRTCQQRPQPGCAVENDQLRKKEKTQQRAKHKNKTKTENKLRNKKQRTKKTTNKKKTKKKLHCCLEAKRKILTKAILMVSAQFWNWMANKSILFTKNWKPGYQKLMT